MLSADLIDAVQEEIEAAIDAAFNQVYTSTTGVNALRSGFGVDVDYTNVENGVFDFNKAQFERSFERNFTSLSNFLFLGQDTDEPQGLIVGLIEKLDQLGQTPLETLDPETGTTGFFVNLRA